MIDENKILTVELKLEKVDIENNKVYVVSKSLTKDFEPVYVLEMLAEASKKKHYIWRHRHPIDPIHTLNHIYAEITNSWVEDGILYSRYDMYDHTKDHLSYIELLKEREEINEPLGLSMRYRKYFNNEGTVIHVDVFEHSGTPFPKCEECENTEVGVCEMTNEKNKDKDKILEESKMDEKQLEEHRKKIEELEALLNSKTEAFEELEAKIETLEKDSNEKEKDLEDAKASSKSLEDSVNELEATVTYLLKKPLIDKILELDDKLPVEIVEWYKTQKEEFLEKEIDRLTVALSTKPIVKSQEESAEDAMSNVGAKDEKFVTIGDKKISKDELFEYVTQDLNLKKKGDK